MQAIVQDSYGSADVLALGEVDVPAIGDDEVLVRVVAAGVDRGVLHLMGGLPYVVRLAGFGLRAPKNKVPGMDVAGVVEAVGPAVTRFAPGEAVCGIGTSTFAEFARAPEAKLVPKPAGLDFVPAAALAISGLTALQAVRDHGGVQAGHKVLITGASGGVGSFAVQLAKAFGADVTGVCSTSKAGFVRALGADRVITYETTDFAEEALRYDVIIDSGGCPSISRLRRALTPTGTAVIVGGETDGKLLGGIDRQLRAVLLSPFLKQKLVMFVSPEKLDDLVTLAELVEAGKLTPAVDRTFPLADAANAVRYVEEGRVAGKVVITTTTP